MLVTTMGLTRLLRDPGEDWPYTPEELPAVFGAPANPAHPLRRRVAYACTAVLVALTGALGNSLVVVNLPQLQGALGLYAYEIAWLPIAYVMAIVPMNLLLVKFRQQFGVRLFVVGTVTTYVLVILAHLFVHSFASSVAVRAASGVAGAAFATQSIFYMNQALPLKWRLRAIVIGLGLPQLATPLARCLFSSELLALGEWHSLYLCELGLALLALCAVLTFTLPAAPRRATYEPLDFLTFVVFGCGVAALSAVIGSGRYLWWHDTPWLGYTLVAAIPLLVTAFLIERHRANPVLAITFLVSRPIIGFIVLSVLLQIGITEQTIGAVGLLTTAGLDNDQLHPLFWIVALAMIAGLLASAIALKPTRLTYMIALDFLIIAVAAALDARATNLTRPEQLYASQALLGFATSFGLGPLFLSALRLTLKDEAEFISFLALYSMTVNFGALCATSLVGTYEIFREKAHSHTLVEHVVPSDPQAITRLQESGHVYAPLTLDPTLRQAEGAALLNQNVTHESAVLAYIDVFQMIAFLAAVTALSLLALILWQRHRATRPP